ncbi:hypothetical protein BCR37DRAFT_379682 [Protomyces lactucae-debilis]|uniref:PX domain-containing protein n=1 Tax=Protomyces lactucae-debilis TaxID=2754530 RepID=A0A1Y2FFH6_PROLT|nr:uncharacterized protein BCR37DRAFT_379682 [Protomyces lactucae-debilis]ORY82662.1 hypothetical protein BCR37DRAFT_379682 [Protomyces lactucae-debilis]
MNSLGDAHRRHYLKKVLLTHLIEQELAALNDPAALARLGPPFKARIDSQLTNGTVKSDAMQETELPILRFVFTKYVATFPFLQKANPEAFWQDKVQVFMEAFAEKRISSSDDRAESSKREKLGARIHSMLVLLFNAGLKAGDEQPVPLPQSTHTPQPAARTEPIEMREMVNGLAVNVAGVRTVTKKRRVHRRETHSEFLIVTYRAEVKAPITVARRYGAFKRLQAQLREEFPGKPLPRLPTKNKAPSTVTSYMPSSFNPFAAPRPSLDEDSGESAEEADEERPPSSSPSSSTASMTTKKTVLREKQRLTLRAYLRALLKDPQLAKSTALKHFLADEPLKSLTSEEQLDMATRQELDSQRQGDQARFLEAAKERAEELSTYMDTFKEQLVKDNGLSKIFSAFRECSTVEELPVEYRKVIEWGRIELSSTLYQLFVSNDNASEFFTQAKRLHALFPYAVLKNIIRFSNPMMMMRAGLDLFLATPFGRASLLQRMFSQTLTEDLKEIEQSIAEIRVRIGNDALCDKIYNFVHADEATQERVRILAEEDEVDLVVALMRTDETEVAPKLDGPALTRVFLANVAWTTALESEGAGAAYNADNARLYGHFLQLLKLTTRARDKHQLMALLFDGATSGLMKDIVTIFYEPLARVYKAASVHNSIMDFSRFADDTIATVAAAQAQEATLDGSAQLVQTFLDLTARHQNSFFRFVHEAHSHDDGLFADLMAWIEEILQFLREGAVEQLDLDALFEQACNAGILDKDKALVELDAVVGWNAEMKVWRMERFQRKMAAQAAVNGATVDNGYPLGSLSGADFGLDQDDLEEVMYEEASDEEGGDVVGETLEEEMDDLDPLEAELKRRKRKRALALMHAAEPQPPATEELLKLSASFRGQVRRILAAS